MMTRCDSRDLFIVTARTIAIIRHHKRAGPSRSGLLVSLNPSQLVRDGLTAAADQFERDVDLANLSETETRALAIAALEKAPVLNWWRIAPTASPPAKFAADEIYVWPETTAFA